MKSCSKDLVHSVFVSEIKPKQGKRYFIFIFCMFNVNSEKMQEEGHDNCRRL